MLTDLLFSAALIGLPAAISLLVWLELKSERPDPKLRLLEGLLARRCGNAQHPPPQA